MNHFKEIVKWIPAIIEKKISELRYLIKINNRIRFVYVNQLRKKKMSRKIIRYEQIVNTNNQDIESKENVHGEQLIDLNENVTVNVEPAVRRTGRSRKKVVRYTSLDFRK